MHLATPSSAPVPAGASELLLEPRASCLKPEPFLLLLREEDSEDMGTHALRDFAAASSRQVGGDSGQPALLYLVPCTLGTVLLLAARRRQLRDMWCALPLLRFVCCASSSADLTLWGAFGGTDCASVTRSHVHTVSVTLASALCYCALFTQQRIVWVTLHRCALAQLHLHLNGRGRKFVLYA